MARVPQLTRSSALPRSLALAGIAAIVTGVGMILALHMLSPTADVDPMRRTISQYALMESAPVFNAAVLALAAGSAAVLVALVGARLVPALSGGALAMLLWCLALAAVVYFPKHNWSVGPSVEGTVHRFASVVAFLSLPVAALLVGRLWRGSPTWGGHAGRTFALGLFSLLCFSPIVIAVVLEPFTGVRWWRAIPLGGVERVLALAEVVTVLSLAWWAAKASRETSPS